MTKTPLAVIEGEHIELKYLKEIEGANDTLILYDTHIHFITNFTATQPVDEDDFSLGWEQTFTNNENIIPRKEITQIKKKYNGDDAPKHWYVAIIGNNGIDIALFYKKHNDANHAFIILSDYLLNKK